MNLRIRTADWSDPVGAALRDAQQAEIRSRYGEQDTEPGEKPTADSVSVFVIAERDGDAVGCGGLRPLDADHGEVKRMYVVPPARGTGVSTAILAELETRATAAGWRRLVLETGTGQPDAVRFYEREGFAPIECWGAYAASVVSLCFGKTI